MNVEDIRAALKQTLEAVDGIRVSTVAQDKPEPPCVFIFPDEPFITYHESMGDVGGTGLMFLHFTGTVLVPLNDDRTAQNLLDSYLSTSTPNSLVDALEKRDDNNVRSLGGALNGDVTVGQASNYGQRQAQTNDARMLGADLAITIRTTRT